jgi:heat shock protein HslJ
VIGLCAVVAACGTSRPSPLGGTWTAIAAAGINIESKSEAPWFQFTEGGRLNGVTGCTEFSAPVSVADATIAIGEFTIGASTPCTPRDREIENAVLAVLRQASAVSGGLPGDRLRLRGAGGELVLAQPAPDLPFDTE